MSELAIFDTPHNEAFRTLGALEPGQHWSSFDVPRNRARAGEATRFVTTIWNWHWEGDDGHRRPTELGISRDQTDGTLWYRIPFPPAGTTKKTWIAHWNGLSLALTNRIPIIGVLKDFRSNRCSLENIFDCGNPRGEIDGSAIWLQLTPRGNVGCEVRPIDIRQLTTEGDTLERLTLHSEMAGSIQRKSSDRLAWRLASAAAKSALLGMVAIPVMLVGAGSGSPVVFWIGMAMAALALLVFMTILFGVSFGALWKLATFR